MKTLISSLANQMQKVFEKENGTLTGGYFSIPRRIINGVYDPLGQNQQNCYQGETVNDTGCTNGECDGSTNGDSCNNEHSCADSTDGRNCAVPPPSPIIKNKLPTF